LTGLGRTGLPTNQANRVGIVRSADLLTAGDAANRDTNGTGHTLGIRTTGSANLKLTRPGTARVTLGGFGIPRQATLLADTTAGYVVDVARRSECDTQVETGLAGYLNAAGRGRSAKTLAACGAQLCTARAIAEVDANETMGALLGELTALTRDNRSAHDILTRNRRLNHATCLARTAGVGSNGIARDTGQTLRRID